jgi:hypothetical protein
MRHDEQRHVWSSLSSEREGKGILCERRGACERACEKNCEPYPKPRPKPEPSSADVSERGVASIGVRSSGNLARAKRIGIKGVCSHNTVSFVQISSCRPLIVQSQHTGRPSRIRIVTLRVCVREEDAGGREADAHSTTPTTVLRGSRAAELVA